MTPGQPFEESTNQEIQSLIARGVFRLEKHDEKKHCNICIFNSRIINEAKGKATDTSYKKSRMVFQGYNDNGK